MIAKELETKILEAKTIAATVRPNTAFTSVDVYDDYFAFGYKVNGNDRMGPCIDRNSMKPIIKQSYEYFLDTILAAFLIDGDKLKLVREYK